MKVKGELVLAGGSLAAAKADAAAAVKAKEQVQGSFSQQQNLNVANFHEINRLNSALEKEKQKVEELRQAAVTDQTKTKTPAHLVQDGVVMVGVAHNEVLPTPLPTAKKSETELFLELHKHVKRGALGLIDGARLDACSGRVGLFTWPRTGSSVRNEVLCELPYNEVMPKIGECFDKAAKFGAFRASGVGR